MKLEITCEEQRSHMILESDKLSSLPTMGLWMKNFTALSLSFPVKDENSWDYCQGIDTAHTVCNTECTGLMPDQQWEALSKYDVVVITATTTTVIVILSSLSALPLSHMPVLVTLQHLR